MALYDRLADLPLSADDWSLERRERETSSGFTRVTTTFRVAGDGAVGRGEDVCYDAEDHDALAASPPDLPTGSFAFGEFSRALADVDLFAEPPERETSRDYRRWAVESAALDLALRGAGESLAGALGRSYDPVRFVASTRLGEAGYGRVEAMLAANPDLEFKLDPTAEWTDGLVDRLAALGRVRVLDLKGRYDGVDVGEPPDPGRYRRLFAAFPDAVIEDPAVTERTRPLVASVADRVAWDAPVHGLADLEALPFAPRWLNVKPSRFGTVASLLETVEHCLANDVHLYGGGQFELGVGRGQLHALASLFYPDAPNDVAPAGYNDPDPDDDLPRSPLAPPEDPVGLGWG